MGWIKSAVKSIKRAGKKVYKNVIKPVVKAVVATVTAPLDWIMDAITPSMPDISTAGASDDQKGTTVNSRAGDAVIPVVYGAHSAHNFVKIGGIEAHISASGTDNKYLYLTYVLCHGMIQNLDIYRDELLSSVGKWTETHNEDDGAYSSDTTQSMVMSDKGVVLWKGFYGSANNTFKPSWHNDKNLYPGLTVFKIRLEYPADEDGKDDTFTRQKPNPVFYIKGIDNSHQSPINSITSNTDKTGISNMYDYLTNSAYGAGIDVADIDGASFTKVFNYFDDRRHNDFYRLSASTVIANIKNMLWYSACALIYEDGKYILRLDPNFVISDLGFVGMVTDFSAKLTDLDITTHTVKAGDIIGGVALTDIPTADIPHKWSYTYIDTETHTLYYPSDSVSLFGGILSALNNSVYDVASKPLPNTDNTQEIKINGPDPKIEFRYWEGRINNSIKITLSPKFANIRVFDIINITYPKANLLNNEYVVTNMTRDVDMSVTLECKQSLRDANSAINVWPVGSWDKLLKEQGLSIRKAKLLRPVGLGLDYNTQVDEFIPNMKIPEIANLVVTSNATDFKKTDSGEWLPNVKVTFDEIVEPSVNLYKIEMKEINSNTWTPLSSGYSAETFIFNSFVFKQGTDYTIAVSAVSRYGTVGNRIEASVYVPFAEGVNISRRLFTVYNNGLDESPIGQVVDETGSISLPEDGGLKWGNLQVPPAPGCVLGSNSTHERYDSWEESASIRWVDAHPAESTTITELQAYYYETDKSRAVKLSPNDNFSFTGYANVKIDTYDNTDTSLPYATYAVGWKVYDSADNLIFTQIPHKYAVINAMADNSARTMGGLANQSYALPYFYIVGHNVSANNNINITEYEFKTHKTARKSFSNIDTSTLTGSAGIRELEIKSNWIHADLSSSTYSHPFSKINNIIITPHPSEPKTIVGSHGGMSYSNGKYVILIKITDVATNLPTDAIVDITIDGVPKTLQTKDENGIYKYYKIAEDL
jgi:hypothetical protein